MITAPLSPHARLEPLARALSSLEFCKELLKHRGDPNFRDLVVQFADKVMDVRDAYMRLIARYPECADSCALSPWFISMLKILEAGDRGQAA